MTQIVVGPNGNTAVVTKESAYPYGGRKQSIIIENQPRPQTQVIQVEKKREERSCCMKCCCCLSCCWICCGLTYPRADW